MKPAISLSEIKQCLLLVATALLLNACALDLSGSNQPSPAKESFSTRVTDNGTKLFIYQLELPTPNNGASKVDRRHYERTGLPKDYYFKRHITSRIDSRLKQKITTTGFCKTGFIELDRIIGKTSASIRGECKEGQAVY